MALRLYEDRIDPHTGQDITLATDPALADYWTTAFPVRDYAAQALAIAQDERKDERHPHTLRYQVGLRPGWEEALAAARAANHERDAAEQHD